MDKPTTVTVCIYSHRNGNDVWTFDSAASAYEVVARRFVLPQLDDELPGIDRMAVRATISGMIERGEFEAAINAYNEANMSRSDVERFDFYDNEVQTAPVESPKCVCPQCGEGALEQFEIMETYTAYHPVRGISSIGELEVENALSTGTPGEHFDDGASDYRVHCRSCQHDGTPEAFNLPANWDWV
jgi:hypothetical protein